MKCVLRFFLVHTTCSYIYLPLGGSVPLYALSWADRVDASKQYAVISAVPNALIEVAQ